MAFLRARPEIDGARIGLAGHSEGGAIAPMVAATDTKIAAIVLLAGPAYTGRRILDFQLRNLVLGDSTIPATGREIQVNSYEILCFPAKELLFRNQLFGPNVEIGTQLTTKVFIPMRARQIWLPGPSVCS